MKIGLISDTHDHFDPRLPQLFEGVAHILHAGDVGRSSILSSLERIAPVTAVLGNNDFDMELRDFEVIELSAMKFLVHHIVNPEHPSEALRRRLVEAQPDVVVGGHSHKAYVKTVGKVKFINPGYAGRMRFGQPRSVAVLHCENRKIEPVFLTLQP